MKMKKRTWLKCFFAIIILLFATILPSQEPDRVKQELFKELDQLSEQCRIQDCRHLAPNNFSKAQLLYLQASQLYDNGERLSLIQETVQKAKASYEAALESTRLSQVVVEKLLLEKNSCKEHEISKLASEEYAAAEAKFSQSVQAVEKGDLKMARDLVKEADDLYRNAAIKGLTSGLLQQAKERVSARRSELASEDFTRLNLQLDDVQQFVMNQQGTVFDINTVFEQVKEKIGRIIPEIVTGIVITPIETGRKAIDLTVDKIIPALSTVFYGDSAVLSLSIGNYGKTPAAHLTVRISDDEIGPLVTRNVDYIESNEVLTLEISFTALQKGVRTLVAEVDPRNMILETNENNNKAETTLVIEDRMKEVREVIPVLSEGRILETQERGRPDTTNLPLLKPFNKERKNWSEMVKTQYGEMTTINAHEQHAFPLSIDKTTLVIVRAYFYAPEPEKLSAQLVRSDQTQPYFTQSTQEMYEGIGLLVAQFPIKDEMLDILQTWSLLLVNDSDLDISAEVMIGLAAFMESD
jgi:hypothetical protein